MDAVEKVYRFYESCRHGKFVYGKSARGLPLVGFFIGRREYPVTLFQYAIHAREWVTALLALEHVKRGLSRGGAYILPLANPDGAALSLREEGFSLWKANAEGVDLNVNFPALWGTGRANVFLPAPENYVGAFPLCAPESRVLARFTRAVTPDAAVSYHTKGGEIYWEFGQRGEALLRDGKIAAALAEETGYAAKMISGSAGGYKDWCIRALRIPSFTIEAGSDALSHPLGEACLPDIVRENIGVPERLAEELLKWKTK